VLYNHLSYEERIKIETLLNEKLSIRDIAKRLNRNPSTISRELKRNYWDAFINKYNFSCADRKYHQRQKIPGQLDKMKNIEIKQYVESKLKIGWSPEQISGRIEIDIPGNSISHESIYKYVYKTGKELIKLLPQKRPKRRKRGDSKQSRKVIIPDRVSIDERPSIINERLEFGHWESDSMVSKQSLSALNVLVERKSGYLAISKLDNLTPLETRLKIISRLSFLPQEIVKSITYDNGIENREHSIINNHLKTDSYFCNPYHSWEKGTVENTNGLIRRYLPKKTDFNKINHALLIDIEQALNNRPRKRHQFRTPLEVLNKSVALRV
jgi:IS30 family transposase